MTPIITRPKRSTRVHETRAPNGFHAKDQYMRYLVLGFCVFATACADTSPTAPTASLSSGAAVSSWGQIGGGAVTPAQHGSELPFKGNLQATEAVDGAVHHLAGTGNGTHLGNFTYSADITVDGQTGEGVGPVIWTVVTSGMAWRRAPRSETSFSTARRWPPMTHSLGVLMMRR